MTNALVLPLLIFLTAVLFSSVGQAGASGYLAVMALCGVAPEGMKPSSLVLNVLVATIGALTFYRAGALRWSRLWPFAMGSVPMAFLGGAIAMPRQWYEVAVGLLLLAAAYQLIRVPSGPAKDRDNPPFSIPLALVSGGAIGLLAGLTGTGGGIFLAPLLLLTRWVPVREAAGITAAFILANSASALAGYLTGPKAFPPDLPLWAAAAILGGLIGARFGAKFMSPAAMCRLLAGLLVVAGLKLIWI